MWFRQRDSSFCHVQSFSTSHISQVLSAGAAILASEAKISLLQFIFFDNVLRHKFHFHFRKCYQVLAMQFPIPKLFCAAQISLSHGRPRPVPHAPSCQCPPTLQITKHNSSDTTHEMNVWPESQRVDITHRESCIYSYNLAKRGEMNSTNPVFAPRRAVFQSNWAIIRNIEQLFGRRKNCDDCVVSSHTWWLLVMDQYDANTVSLWIHFES